MIHASYDARDLSTKVEVVMALMWQKKGTKGVRWAAGNEYQRRVVCGG